MIAVGILDALQREVSSVAVFRPIVKAGERDAVLEVLVSQPQNEQEYEDAVGVTYEDVRDDPNEALSRLVDKLKAITGRLDLLHANDSRDAFDSGADRHANLGRGECDPDGLTDAIRSAGCPIVIETPGPLQAHLDDLTYLRQALGM